MDHSRLLSEIFNADTDRLLAAWVASQKDALSARPDLLSREQLARQSHDVFNVLAPAMASGKEFADVAWDRTREALAHVSSERARQGFSPSETATFVLSLKQPLFDAIRARVKPEEVGPTLWDATLLVDELALYTTEMATRAREATIQRQQAEMMELSTPVVTLWSGVLALPLIGTLDSERTQVVMENLLNRIVETGATIAILDITGVPTVDTLVAQHLLKTVAAARLMGADCIISGIRPQIAQTIVHLGVDLNTVTTKATLADAFAVALKRSGLVVTSDRGAEGQAATLTGR
jgi:rsbT co-antagonist protein RsbR